MTRISLGVFTALLSATCLSQPAWAENIGSVAAVNRDMAGTPPASARRDLSLGDLVVRDEKIETSSLGSGQLIFSDQTTLTIAPNSNITLDKFVYDPATQTGEIALRMTQGAMRFIGGRITKQTPATIKTPLATIGIRGGIGLVVLNPDGSGTVVLIAGETLTITGADGSQVTLSRSNASATVSPTGTVSFGGLVTTEQLADFYGLLEVPGDGGSNVRIVETDADGVAAVNSAVIGGEDAAVVSTLGENPADDGDETGDTPEFDEHPEVQILVLGPTDPEGPPPILPLPGEGVVLTGDPDGSIFVDPVVAFSEGSVILDTESGNVASFELPQQTTDPRFTLDNAFLGTWNDQDQDVHFFGLDDNNELITTTDLTAVSNINPDDQFHAIGVSQDREIEVTTIEFDEETGSPIEVISFETVSVNSVAVFGDTPDDRGEFHRDDAESSYNQANTVDVFNQFGPDLFMSDESGVATGASGNVSGQIVDYTLQNPLGGDGTLFLIGNSGVPRFSGGDSGEQAFGGRWLYGQISPEGLGVFTGSATGPDGPGLSTNITNIFGDTIQEQGVGTVGSLADGATSGSALWGEEGGFLVLSTTRRQQDEGGLGAYTDQLGTTRFFGQDYEGSLSQMSSDDYMDYMDPYSEDVREFENFHVAQTFVRDPDASGIVQDPLPLAGSSIARGGAMTLDVLATGFFTCRTGSCGQTADFGGEEELEVFFGEGRSNVYAFLPEGGSITFGSDDGMPASDQNQVSATFSGQAEPNANASLEFFNGQFNDFVSVNDGILMFGSGEFGSNGAAVSDSIFGINEQDTARLLLEDESSPGLPGEPPPDTLSFEATSEESNFLVASYGLVGAPTDDFFPTGTNTEPEYVRWGWWAATYQVSGSQFGFGFDRTDILNLGTWVAGDWSDAADLPFAGTASYDGFVAASMADLGSGTVTPVGGNFNLSYDFFGAEGTFVFSIPDAGYNNVNVDVLPGALGGTYQGNTLIQATGPADVQVTGGFAGVGGTIDVSGETVSGGVAATAGHIDILEAAAGTAGNGVHTVGVFGGDITGYVPAPSF